MQRIFNYQTEKPKLYLIPTPIGNLEDITLRALNTLKIVDKIYAEDTRVTLKLLSHFEIKKPLFSLHEHNEATKTKDVLKDLENGLSIGLVSDAGMPLISDPGFGLVNQVKNAGYPVIALPGANALLPALAMSGIKTHPFLFYGFLDAKKHQRKAQLEDLRYRQETLVFYEAIHRIKATLVDMRETFGNRTFVIAREISKAYEEIIHGSFDEADQLPELKGELVLMIEGYEPEIEQTEFSIVEQVDFFVKSGLKKTEAMKRVSAMTGLPKNQIYQTYLNEKIEKE